MNTQRYEAYKDSGFDKRAIQFESYTPLKMRYVFNFYKGLSITKENLHESGIPCVNYGEIHSKYGFEVIPEKHDLKCVDKEYLKTTPTALLNKDDFVFADTSEDIEGSGNFIYLNSKIKTFAGYHTVIARLAVELSARYIAYVLDSVSFRKQIRSSVKGVKVYSITQSILKDQIVWYPSLTKQTTIANYLDDKTAKIDQAIALKEQLIARLKERKQIIIQHAVTKGLNPDAPLKDSGVEWIGEMPVHWEVKRLKLLTKINNGQEYKHIVSESGFPVFGSGGRFAFAKDYLYDGEALLLGRKGTIDKPLYVNEKFWAVDTMFYAISKSGYSTKYLYYLSQTIPFLFYSTSTALPSMTQDDLNNHKVAVPTLFEQKQIVKHIETQSQKIDTAITQQQTQIDHLKAYKATLIDSAVTGKINVC